MVLGLILNNFSRIPTTNVHPFGTPLLCISKLKILILLHGSFYELRKVGKDFSHSLNYIYFTIFYAFALHFYILNKV